jgi:hypothetical protein
MRFAYAERKSVLSLQIMAIEERKKGLNAKIVPVGCLLTLQPQAV